MSSRRSARAHQGVGDVAQTSEVEGLAWIEGQVGGGDLVREVNAALKVKTNYYGTDGEGNQERLEIKLDAPLSSMPNIVVSSLRLAICVIGGQEWKVLLLALKTREGLS